MEGNFRNGFLVAESEKWAWRKKSRNIADISCIGRRRHGIFRRKIRGRFFAKNRQLIADKSAIYRWKSINRRFFQIITCGCGKSSINRRLLGIFRSSLSSAIWRPRSRPRWSNGPDVIPTLIMWSNGQICPNLWSNGQIWFSMVNWCSNDYFGPNFFYKLPFFHQFHPLLLSFFICSLITPILRYVYFKL